MLHPMLSVQENCLRLSPPLRAKPLDRRQATSSGGTVGGGGGDRMNHPPYLRSLAHIPLRGRPAHGRRKACTTALGRSSTPRRVERGSTGHLHRALDRAL